MDTGLRSQSLRAAASCPTGKLPGVLYFSKRRQLNNSHGRVLARQELSLRAGDVSPPALLHANAGCSGSLRAANPSRPSAGR